MHADIISNFTAENGAIVAIEKHCIFTFVGDINK